MYSSFPTRHQKAESLAASGVVLSAARFGKGSEFGGSHIHLKACPTRSVMGL